jgi:hypothetical protein
VRIAGSVTELIGNTPLDNPANPQAHRQSFAGLHFLRRRGRATGCAAGKSGQSDAGDRFVLRRALPVDGALRIPAGPVVVADSSRGTAVGYREC